MHNRTALQPSTQRRCWTTPSRTLASSERDRCHGHAASLELRRMGLADDVNIRIRCSTDVEVIKFGTASRDSQRRCPLPGRPSVNDLSKGEPTIQRSDEHCSERTGGTHRGGAPDRGRSRPGSLVYTFWLTSVTAGIGAGVEVPVVSRVHRGGMWVGSRPCRKADCSAPTWKNTLWHRSMCTPQRRTQSRASRCTPHATGRRLHQHEFVRWRAGFSDSGQPPMRRTAMPLAAKSLSSAIMRRPSSIPWMPGRSDIVSWPYSSWSAWMIAASQASPR